MTITHFIEGGHTTIINEYPYTRIGPFDQLLRWQRKHNPEGVAQDKDLQRAFIQMEGKDVKKRRKQRSRDDVKDEEYNDYENPAKRL